MNRVQGSACPRRSVVAACRALPASVSLTLVLVALACASAAPQARAGSFDWRSRGILFRIVADVPVDAGPGSAAATSTAIGVDAIPSPPPPMTTATQVQPEPSFLFATIHYGSTEQQGLFLAGLRERLEASRMLVNELSGAEQWRPEYEAYRSLGQGQRLSTLLGTRAFAQLQAQLPAYTAATLDGLQTGGAPGVGQRVGRRRAKAARIRVTPKPGARAAPELAGGYPGICAVAGATGGVHGAHARRPQAVGGDEHARDAGRTGT